VASPLAFLRRRSTRPCATLALLPSSSRTCSAFLD
jgi:hypothetical protein